MKVYTELLTQEATCMFVINFSDDFGELKLIYILQQQQTDGFYCSLYNCNNTAIVNGFMESASNTFSS